MVMYLIDFYKDKNGYSQPAEYITALSNSEETNKSARIELKQINFYIAILSRLGTRAGEKYVKYIDKDIWELRPSKNRFFFAVRRRNTFIILHQYQKKSQKMDNSEFNKACNKLKDFDAREAENER